MYFGIELSAMVPLSGHDLQLGFSLAYQSAHGPRFDGEDPPNACYQLLPVESCAE